MSVKVTYLSSNDTDLATADWGGHKHHISQSDHEVPSIEDHRALESKVSDCQQDIARVQSKIKKSDERLAEFAVPIPNLSTEIGNVRSRLEHTVKALNETGQLATAFKSIVDKHLADIQKVINVLSIRINEGENELKAKTSDSLGQIKKTAHEITTKIRESELAVSAAAQKSKKDIAELGKIKEQAVAALKNAAAIVQKQLSEYIKGETAKLEAIEQSVRKSADSVRESVGKIAELQEATDKLESRLKLIEEEDALGKLAEIVQKYREVQASCQDTLSAANYFRSVNRSFFSRLWWCLTGRCNEA